MDQFAKCATGRKVTLGLADMESYPVSCTLSLSVLRSQGHTWTSADGSSRLLVFSGRRVTSGPEHKWLVEALVFPLGMLVY